MSRIASGLGHRTIFSLSLGVAGALLLSSTGTVRAATETELAGRQLAVFPHFEYQRTFLLTQAITGEVAVDPIRHPQVAGASCDLYVVEAKSAAEWAADATLTDVRPGGAQPLDLTSCATSISQCIHTVQEWSLLSTDAEPGYYIDEGSGPAFYYAGLGRPYDVVLDCDLAPQPRGTLSAADFVDGGDDRVGFYLTHDPVVARLPVKCRGYEVDLAVSPPPPQVEAQRVYIPTHLDPSVSCTGTACSDPAPLVVITHGRGHNLGWYDYLQSHLASYGYVVLAHETNTSNIPVAAESTIRHTNRFLEVLADANCASLVTNQSACSGEGATTATFSEVCDLAGRVDTTRIVWIGHSRGGNAVVWAYNSLDPGHPDHISELTYQFGEGDIALLAGLAPTDRPLLASPEEKPYFMMSLGGDADMTGTPGVAERENMSFQLYERARGHRQSVYIHGGAHGFFHESCDGTVDCLDADIEDLDCGCRGLVGPSEALVHSVVQRYLVPVLQCYLDENVPSEDFFWRPYARFTGDTSVRVVLEHKRGMDEMRVEIDDYEKWTNESVGSQGQAVTFNLAVVDEAEMEDADCHFDWIRGTGSTGGTIPDLCSGVCGVCNCSEVPAGVPDVNGTVPCDFSPSCAFAPRQTMNGMTRSRPGSLSHGVVLEWLAALPGQYYEWDITGLAAGGLTEDMYLSFRAAQMPRHPNTVAVEEDLDFTVTLIDADDAQQAIRIGAYEAGIEEPFARFGPFLEDETGIYDCFCSNGGKAGGGELCCEPDECNPRISDKGWQAEFETVRIRLGDFLTGGSGVDLGDLKALRFEFGTGFGSPEGRMAVDDVEFISPAILHAMPCPTVEPCGGPDCVQGVELGAVDTGLSSCQPSSGPELVCGPATTVHVVTYVCSQASCCSDPVPCLCREEGCPAGTELQCR